MTYIQHVFLLEKVGDSNEVPIVQCSTSKGPEYYKQRLNHWNKMFDDLKMGKKATTTE